MAIFQGVCKSFKTELLQGIHDFSSDTIKIALYESSADLSQNTTAYSATGEVSETGYTAGGSTITAEIVAVGNAYEVVFDDVSWTSEITARGALVYNSSKSNKAIAVLSFGIDRSSVSGVFTLVFPASGGDFPVLKLA